MCRGVILAQAVPVLPCPHAGQELDWSEPLAFGSAAVTRPPVVAGVQGAARIRAVVSGRCDLDLPCSAHLWSGLS